MRNEARKYLQTVPGNEWLDDSVYMNMDGYMCWANCGGGIPARGVRRGRAFLRLRMPKAAGDETRKGREKGKAGLPAVCSQKWDVECRRSRRGGCPFRGGPRVDEALGLMDAKNLFKSGFFVGLLPELTVPREPGWV